MVISRWVVMTAVLADARDSACGGGKRDSSQRAQTSSSVGLETEPWLFTLDRNGQIAERVEGSFGFNAVSAAIKRAIGS